MTYCDIAAGLYWRKPVQGDVQPLYSHPAHDDTALLRMALEALDTIYASTHPYREDGSSTLSTESVELSNAAITALRERLGEKA